MSFVSPQLDTLLSMGKRVLGCGISVCLLRVYVYVCVCVCVYISD